MQLAFHPITRSLGMGLERALSMGSGLDHARARGELSQVTLIGLDRCYPGEFPAEHP